MTNKKVLYVPDTNALLNFPNFILENPSLLTRTVLRELTELEHKEGRSRQYKVRQAKRAIKEAIHHESITIAPEQAFPDKNEVNDVKILNEIDRFVGMNPFLRDAEEEDYKDGIEPVLVTDDILMGINAKARDIPYKSVYDFNRDDKHLKGVIELMFEPGNKEQEEILAKVVEVSTGDMDVYYNPFDMFKNQYLVIWDTSTEEVGKDGDLVYDLVATYKFNGNRLVRLKFKKLNGFEKLKPINIKQQLAFDMLQDRDTPAKLISGVHGSGY